MGKGKEKKSNGEDDATSIPRRKQMKRDEPHDSGEKRRNMKTTKKREKERKVVAEEKKACDLPGQKHETLGERDPLRIFFETLYRQLPHSEIAAVWMMEWGLLPPDEAKKVYEKAMNGHHLKLGSPDQAISVKKTPKASIKHGKDLITKGASKTKKRKVNRDGTPEDKDRFISSTKKIKKHKVSS